MQQDYTLMSTTSRNKTSRYQKLRASLIQRGITLRGFALQHGYCVPTVYMAARGQRAGVESVKIINHLNEVLK